jgi:crotonobetainyl-CoA:carnitine CoA-transferase CaiB-like acyl-CoA transferase
MQSVSGAGQTGALAGVRVLDFSHALAGPYCTLLMSDFGAAIYKLEGPGGGDMGRGWGPPFAGEQSSFFVGLNRGKYGISIDLKRHEGIELCLRLLDAMDVLIENFRPGTMDRLGLGYNAVSARNPRLIYCSISGYGQNGPSRDEAAMDLIVECSSGFLSITGPEEGEPVRSGYAVCDINAGLFATIGILTALRAREQTGRGQYVDVSMLDSMISAMSSNYVSFLGSGEAPRPLGTGFQTVVPYRVFEATDRSFSIAIGSEKLWATFCNVIGRPDLALHPEYSTNALRVTNRRVLEAILESTFRERPMAEWVESMRSAGIPCSPVRSFQEVMQDPQTAARGMFPEVVVPSFGKHRVTGPPVKLSATPGRVGASAPALGQHTHTVLSDLLGMDDASIGALAEAGIIGPRNTTPATRG